MTMRLLLHHRHIKSSKAIVYLFSLPKTGQLYISNKPLKLGNLIKHSKMKAALASKRAQSDTLLAKNTHLMSEQEECDYSQKKSVLNRLLIRCLPQQ